MNMQTIREYAMRLQKASQILQSNWCIIFLHIETKLFVV